MQALSQLQLHTWIARCREGDVDALEELYHATSPHLLARLPHVPEGEAEHVLAGIYMKAWRRAAEYDPAVLDPLCWLESFFTAPVALAQEAPTSLGSAPTGK